MKIVTIGGGTGGSIIDEALAKSFPNLTAIVTSFDNGGSSGILRREFGTLPQGDIRRRIFAQRKKTNDDFNEIYNFRFDKDNSLEDHSFGNLMILVAQKIWGEKVGMQKICNFFQIRGKVLPVTYDYAELAAKLKNGKRILGEDLVGQSQITKRNIIDEREIEKVYLTRATKINREVVSEIKKAEWIILCPGDFYTSLVPNFLVPGFCKAVKNSKGKVVLFVNIMTKKAETHNFKVSDFVKETEKYLGKKIDYAVVNNGGIKSSVIRKYKKEESATMVVNDLKQKDLRILEADLIKNSQSVRHDKKKVLKIFKEIMKKDKIKKKYVFDLDDTLIPTYIYDKEYIKGNYKNLIFFKNIKKVLQKLRKENIILLTYDKCGDQPKKLKHLKLEKYFSEIFVVDDRLKKLHVLKKLQRQYKNLVVVGDRYEDGELSHAHKLKIPTICVAMQGGTHYDKTHHGKHALLIEKEEDFLSMI